MYLEQFGGPTDFRKIAILKMIEKSFEESNVLMDMYANFMVESKHESKVQPRKYLYNDLPLAKNLSQANPELFEEFKYLFSLNEFKINQLSLFLQQWIIDLTVMNTGSSRSRDLIIAKYINSVRDNSFVFFDTNGGILEKQNLKVKFSKVIKYDEVTSLYNRGCSIVFNHHYSMVDNVREINKTVELIEARIKAKNIMICTIPNNYLIFVIQSNHKRFFKKEYFFSAELDLHCNKYF